MTPKRNDSIVVESPNPTANLQQTKQKGRSKTGAASIFLSAFTEMNRSVLLNSLKNKVSQRNFHRAKLRSRTPEHMIVIQGDHLIDQQVSRILSWIATLAIIKHGSVSEKPASARRVNRKFALTFIPPSRRINLRLPAH